MSQTQIDTRYACCVCGGPLPEMPLNDPEWLAEGYMHSICTTVCFIVFKRFPL